MLLHRSARSLQPAPRLASDIPTIEIGKHACRKKEHGKSLGCPINDHGMRSSTIDSLPIRCPVRQRTISRRTLMGKYFLAWLLGVPAIVLVLIYLFLH
jgi:hypothetical protein